MTSKFNLFKQTLSKNKAEAVLIVLGSIFYIFMMAYRLTYSPLWFDEYIERIISQMSLKSGEMYSNIIITFQPPLYNFLMHFWLKASTSLLWFRLFNVILGLITGYCVYNSIRILYGFKPAFCGLMLLSCCYQYIYCVQECSEYQLMVMFISLSLLFFIKAAEAPDYINEFLFVFFAVCAMYSQYGAMFFAIPFLCIFYLRTLLNKNKLHSIYVTILYAISFVCGAIPLYVLYASKQLKENAIADHTTVHFGLSELLSLFTEPGRILGYLFNVPVNAVTEIIEGTIGVLYIIASIYIIIKYIKSTKKIIAEAVLGLLCGYVLHYFLVIFHVYAMVHPGQSGGFYARYSYFYIPVIVFTFVLLAIEIKRLLVDNQNRNIRLANTIIVSVFAISVVTFLVPQIMKNWHKTYDDLFAKTWVDGHGWENPTYLIGQAKYGFDFYIKDVYGEAAASNSLHESQLDVNYMPNDFWLWRTGWGGDAFETFTKEASARGYNVNILYDYGLEGQLAHVTVK